jgi:hypothetical protein
MSKSIKLLVASIMVTVFGLPLSAQAVDQLRVSCSVAVDSDLNGVPQDSYHKDFVAVGGVPFSEDLSTALRSKFFTASVTREAGKPVVTIDFFADLNVVDQVDISTRLTLHSEKGIESTSGSYTFSNSQAASPGNHRTNYTLSCRRT